MTLSPLVAIHMSAALTALAIGPVAIWARRARQQRPRLHRGFGYAWVALIVATAVTALFIRSHTLPNIAGYTPVHLLIPLTLAGLFFAFQRLLKGDIVRHRRIMQIVYFGGCIGAGLFTLLPNRYLGQWLLGSWPA